MGSGIRPTKGYRCLGLDWPRRAKNIFSVLMDDLDEDFVPVFPIIRSIPVENFSIHRMDSICAAFSLTDDKVQSQTLTEAVPIINFVLKMCSYLDYSPHGAYIYSSRYKCPMSTFNLILGHRKPIPWRSGSTLFGMSCPRLELDIYSILKRLRKDHRNYDPRKVI